MIIYRVQNAKGEGPYSAGWGEAGYDAMHMSGTFTGKDSHPAPNDDWSCLKSNHDPDLGTDEMRAYWRDDEVMRALVREHKFAFPTYQAVINWFGVAGLSYLRREGFNVVEIDAPVVSISDSGKQCMFKL